MKVLYKQELEPQDAKRIIEAGLRYGTTMCIWSDNQLYGNQLNDRIHEYSQAAKIEPLPTYSFALNEKHLFSLMGGYTMGYDNSRYNSTTVYDFSYEDDWAQHFVNGNNWSKTKPEDSFS